jgi:sodium transport system permease protein
MSGWFTVFRKETRENLRDRRTLTSALLFGPLMFPAMLTIMLTVVGAQKKDDLEKPLSLPVTGAQVAPNLVAWLQRQSVSIEPTPADARQAVLDKEAEVVMEIPASYADDWRAGRPAQVLLHFDRTNERAMTALARIEALLDRYGATIGSLRLTVRGVDPQIMRPLSVEERDASGVPPLLAALVSFLPYGLMFAAFFGGMYLAIDSTSGERERLTLEPLLLNPVPRAQLVLGKLAATVAFSTVSLSLCVTAMAVGLSIVPAMPSGVELELGPLNAVKIFVVALPLVLMASASQMLLASLTRSYREAQTYVQLFQLVPMAPSIVQMVNPVAATKLTLALPAMSQSVLISLIGKGREIELWQVALSWAGTLAVGVAFAIAVVFVYRREKLLG